MTTKALATRQAFSIVPGNMSEAIQLAQLIAKSGLAPKDFKNKPDDVLIAIMMGGEIGLAPMQALQNIAVINGRPTIWGDAVTALIYQHPDLEWIEEHFDNADNPQVAFCTVKRKGNEPHTRQFSIKDATKAGLMAKDTWKCYTSDMLKNRARKALWDKFPDALKGLSSAEEVQDMVEVQPTTIKDVTPTNQGAKILEKLGITADTPIIEASDSVPEPEAPLDPEAVVTVLPVAFNPEADGNNKLYAVIVDWLGGTAEANAFLKNTCGIKTMKAFNEMGLEARTGVWNQLNAMPKDGALFS